MCTCAWAWVWAWACASLSSYFSDSFHVPSCVSEALPLLVGVQAPPHVYLEWMQMNKDISN